MFFYFYFLRQEYRHSHTLDRFCSLTAKSPVIFSLLSRSFSTTANDTWCNTKGIHHPQHRSDVSTVCGAPLPQKRGLVDPAYTTICDTVEDALY